MTQNLDQNFWNSRWEHQETGWDIGYASPAISHYLMSIRNKDLSILIPGCGNAYEAQFLLEKGFKNITLIDIATQPVARLQSQFITDNIRILCEDFFEHTGSYDLILEQTFFCALPVNRRAAYAEKMKDLLLPGGRLTGLLFSRAFEKEGPPFGGTKEEYLPYFKPHFTILKMEPCYNSISPRDGSELFIELERR